jgi:hypothetical protein
MLPASYWLNWPFLQNIVIAAVLLYKGKTIPLQALTGPVVSRRLRLPDFEIIGT